MCIWFSFVYEFMYVYLFLCVCVCMCVCVYAYFCVRDFLFVFHCVFLCVCLCVCICCFFNLFICVCVCVCVCVCELLRSVEMSNRDGMWRGHLLKDLGDLSLPRQMNDIYIRKIGFKNRNFQNSLSNLSDWSKNKQLNLRTNFKGLWRDALLIPLEQKKHYFHWLITFMFSFILLPLSYNCCYI